jgi:hypothetical protein
LAERIAFSTLRHATVTELGFGIPVSVYQFSCLTFLLAAGSLRFHGSDGVGTGMASQPEEWPWSSARFHLNLAESSVLLGARHQHLVRVQTPAFLWTDQWMKPASLPPKTVQGQSRDDVPGRQTTLHRRP